MSDIVSGVLKHTFGFLANKIRKEVAERLKDGDVTDEECRRLMVRELDDIKSKLDSLARKDLLSSLCFLQEGVNRLYQSLQFPSTEQASEATLVEATSLATSASPINEASALINAITSLKLLCNERFKSAKESFKLAREKATEAFCNEALSIEDRIQAAQIRIMARILENMEDPDASVSDCLQYLKQLHDVGAIRQIFSVLIDGGVKSRLNRTKRLSTASSVQDMNVILFDFSRKFTKLPEGICNWPTIFAGKEIYNPLFGEKREAVVGKLERSGVQLSSRGPDFTFKNKIKRRYSVVNSKGEIVAMLLEANTIKIFTRSGESRTVCEVPMEEQMSKCLVVEMNIDAEDNIHVITAFRESAGQFWSFKLFIFDEIGNKKLETPLSFLQTSADPYVRLTINKGGRIAVLHSEKRILYIGKVCAEMNSYEVEQSFHLKELQHGSAIGSNLLTISDVNGYKIIVNEMHAVYIYAENGRLQRKIMIAPEHGTIALLAIDHTTKSILVKTSQSLLNFSETGELIYSLSLDSSNWNKLTSHPNGAVVLVGETEAMLVK